MTKEIRMAKKLYHDQYCPKHDQWYADFLHECPICVGEKIGAEYAARKKPERKED